ncbi:MAG: PfkB family carbohydrate kinase, partial [Armatimonadota bacterium]
VMPDLFEYTDVAVGNEEDADKMFGIHAPGTDVEAGEVDAEAYEYVGEKLMERFSNLDTVCITLRGSISASHNTWSGVLYDGEKLHIGPQYDITHIVDRVGGGDSFASAMIYAILDGRDPQGVVDFAVSGSCLKHTIHGDCNLVSVDEVEDLMKSGGSGRVKR